MSSGEVLALRAFAKINLYLRVGSRRDDGYHDLQTVFHSISLSDTLHFRRSLHLDVTCSDPEVPSGAANIVHRAAVKLQERIGTSLGAEIQIEKRIPSQAGLGGGSADAAAALIGLQQLWGVQLPPQEQMRLAAELGADVPFCLQGGAAYAEGIGERLRELPPMHGHVIVIKPFAAVSTGAAYALLDSCERAAGPSPGEILQAISEGDYGRLPPLLYNDFQAAVMQQQPEIAAAHEAVSDVTEGALLCGSGSAVFGLARDQASARTAAAQLDQQGWRVFVARLQPRGVSTPPECSPLS